MNYLRSKTVMFGAALTLASAIQIMVPFFPAQYVGIAGAIIGAVIIILRYVTTLPLDQK